jgi:hypothetical protein
MVGSLCDSSVSVLARKHKAQKTFLWPLIFIAFAFPHHCNNATMMPQRQLLHLLLPCWRLHCRGCCPLSPLRCWPLQQHASPASIGYITILSQQEPARWLRIALSCLPGRPLLTKRRTVVVDGSNVCPCTCPPPSLRPYFKSLHATCGGIDRRWISPCFPPRNSCHG